MNKPLSLALFCLLLPITAHADNPPPTNAACWTRAAAKRSNTAKAVGWTRNRHAGK